MGSKKFIRVRGKVIAIDSEKYMKKQSSKDREVASKSRKVAAGSLAIAAGSAAIASLKNTKNKFKFAAIAGASLLNAAFAKGHADGREMSAKDRDQYAKDLKSGKKIKKGKGIGGASDIAYNQAKFLSKLSSIRKKPTEVD